MSYVMPNLDASSVSRLIDVLKNVPGVTGLNSSYSMAEGCNVLVFKYNGEPKQFINENDLIAFVRKVFEDEKREREGKPEDYEEPAKTGFEKDLAEKQNAARLRSLEFGLDNEERAHELAFANKIALDNADRHGEPTPLDKLDAAVPDAYDVAKTVNRHRAKEEAFELGAVEVIDVSDDVEVKENERAMKVVVEAYGFTVSEIIVGPKDGDHMPLCVDLIEKQTHRLFTAIDALRARNIRIR